MIKQAFQFYNSKAFTHNYIIGFCDKGIVYYVKAKSSQLVNLLAIDKGSRGSGWALRFKPNKTQKAILFTLGAERLCTECEFEAMVANSKYNRGEIFEKLITELLGQTWHKDNVPFTDGPDVEANGIGYQIKYNKATFINEAQARRLGFVA